jgi:hypothetical protein
MLSFTGIPYYIDENLPLRSTKRHQWDDYELVEIESDLLCLMVGGKLYIHPDRMPLIEAALKR